MKKKVLATLVAFIAILAQAVAGPVSKEQAKEFATNFLIDQGVALQGELSVIEGPVRAADMRDAAPCYYVFNNGQDGGFVIISGDNRTQMVLGFSTKGHFNFNEENPATMLLKQYASELDILDRMNVTAPIDETLSGMSHLQTPTHEAIQPLITCEWNQSAPYNASCPVYNTKTTLSGCVTVAMAQLVYYYRDRMSATLQKAIPGYTTKTLKIKVNGVASGTKLNYANMYDRYDGTQSSAQKTAVANLIFYCAAALGADFHTSATSAKTAYIPTKLEDYFGFCSATKCERESYTYAQWKELLLSNLYQTRPVLYRAVENSGTLGHSFLIDGYDGGDLFHINWGWGGQSNGFYSLSVLNPFDVEGEDAFIKPTSYEQNYIKDQVAYLNLQPVKGYNDQDPRTALTCLINSVSGSTVAATFTNKTNNTGKFLFGLGYLDSKEQLQVLKTYSSSTTSLAKSAATSALKFTLETSDFSAKKLAKGTYTLFPISKISGGEWEICEQNSTPKFVKAVYSTSLSLSLQTSGSKLTVKEIKFPGDCCKGNAKQPVDVTIVNEGEDFFGSLYLFASTSSSKGTYKSTSKPFIPAGKKVTLRFYFSSASASTYNIWVASDDAGSKVLGQSKVTISSTAYQRYLVATDHKLKDESSTKVVIGNTIQGSVVITNKASCKFADYLRIYVMKKVSSWSSTSSRMYTYLELKPGESKTLNFRFDDLDPAYKYALAIYYDDVTTVKSGYLYSNISVSYAPMWYDEEGNIAAIKPASTITVPANAIAVDFTGTTGTVKKVVPNSNPNTIYLVGATESIISGLSGKNFVKGNSADAITLSNKYSFYTPRWFTAKKITFKLVPTLGTTGTAGWQTVVMPFDAEKVTCEGYTLDWFKSANDYGKNFWLKEFSAIEGQNTVCFGYAQDIKANHPYLYAVPGTKWGEANNLVGKTMEFTGTNAIVYNDPITVSASPAFNFRGSYSTQKVEKTYQLDKTGAKFNYISGATTVKPFTCYFVKTEDDITDVNALNIGTFISDVDGIDMMETEKTGIVEVYNVNGMKVGTAEVYGDKVNLEGFDKGIYIIRGKKFVVK